MQRSVVMEVAVAARFISPVASADGALSVKYLDTFRGESGFFSGFFRFEQV